MAVVGPGDLELADLVSPGITVVGYDPVRIGRTAGDGPPRRAELPVRLTPRGSAEFPPED